MTPFQKNKKKNFLKFLKGRPGTSYSAWVALRCSDQPLSSATATELLLFAQKVRKRPKKLFLAQTERVPAKRS